MKPRTASSSVWIVRNPGAAQEIADFLICADPGDEDRLGLMSDAVPDTSGRCR